MKDAVYADMHTHSVFSHDSVCPVGDMALSQMAKGTRIFAVTDHCDVYSYRDYDVFTPVKRAFDEVAALNEKYAGECLVLAGVEISEGIWYPDQYKIIRDLAPYDVIVGSVHCVRHERSRAAFSKIDFSLFGDREIYDYTDRYFDDMIEMLDTEELDVLAHLTCPLRYIAGKYGRKVELSAFGDKIERIFKTIIDGGIALEVNTSALGILGETMPGRALLQKYRGMGGELVTLGSDAHVAENASAGFPAAAKLLKEIGFDSICYYRKRRVNKIKI